ncbi:MAG TPA: hypothetical protein VFB45_15265 [Pseudolabrys sp.]|nr:hypothetical protein [Pseudolabrys sp.]
MPDKSLEVFRREAWVAYRANHFSDQQLALIISDLQRGLEIARNADLGRILVGWFAIELSSAESIRDARARDRRESSLTTAEQKP